MRNLVSIILPFYNAETYLSECIGSVLNQTHQNWELILINDGSTDESNKVARSFVDKRIFYLEQKNQGVSTARNLGLDKMKGDYFCFLDADDAFTVNSISSRLEVFEQNDRIGFVDGTVHTFDESMNQFQNEWTPSFIGKPLQELVKLNDSCFFGITWMIKNDRNCSLRFNQNLSIGEDLFFYVEYSKFAASEYNYTKEPIYKRRTTPGSASSSIGRLADGYHTLFDLLNNENYLEKRQAQYLKKKIRSIILRSSLRRRDFITFLREIVRSEPATFDWTVS